MYVDGKLLIAKSDKPIYILPKMANRHGIISGATGERVIIVMGAVNVMKPRVSGTLNKYILCIA